MPFRAENPRLICRVGLVQLSLCRNNALLPPALVKQVPKAPRSKGEQHQREGDCEKHNGPRLPVRAAIHDVRRGCVPVEQRNRHERGDKGSRKEKHGDNGDAFHAGGILLRSHSQ